MAISYFAPLYCPVCNFLFKIVQHCDEHDYPEHRECLSCQYTVDISKTSYQNVYKEQVGTFAFDPAQNRDNNKSFAYFNVEMNLLRIEKEIVPYSAPNSFINDLIPDLMKFILSYKESKIFQ